MLQKLQRCCQQPGLIRQMPLCEKALPVAIFYCLLVLRIGT